MKQDIKEEYAVLLQRAKTPKERSKLLKRMAQDQQDVLDSVDLLRGYYGQPNDFSGLFPTTLRVAQTGNYLRLMGESAVASSADVGSIVLNEGFTRTFGAAFKLYLNPMKSELLQMKKSELKQLIIGVESVMNSRHAALTEMDPFISGANKLERAGHYASAKMSTFNLMNVWMDFVRTTEATLSQDRLIRTALGKFDDRLGVAKAASSYLGKRELALLKKQFEKHGQIVDGLYFANMQKWDLTSPEIADLYHRFLNGVLKDVDTTIVKPGSNVPTSIKDYRLKPIVQFKSFMFAATQDVLVKAAQRGRQGDLNVVTGIGTMIGLGAFTYMAKQALHGREIDSDPRTLISEGIDRSGVLGILGEGNNLIEKMTGNVVGLRPALGAAPATRYIDRNILESALGPTAGVIQTTQELTQSTLRGGFDQSDIHKLRQFIPFQNTLGIRYIYDSIEGGINNALGVPESK